jgi:drug/metabolite transporter (DMT)-like permease
MDALLGFSGELFALLAAFLWAFSSVLFSDLGKTIKPVELNLIKGIGAILLLTATSLLLKETVGSLSLQVIILLFISGAIGIGFGDTMYFEAINYIGPRRSLLISTVAPIITALLALIFLGEKIAPLAWIGVVVTTLGVTWVITQMRGRDEVEKHVNSRGLVYAFLFALAQAIGAVISRWALTETSISPLQSAVVRLFAGIAFLFIWIAVRRIKLGEWARAGRESAKTWRIVLTVVVLGAYFPLWLQQLSFKHTAVGVAQTLLTTAPLFILPMTALRRDKASLKEILGVVIAVAGIAILFLVH